MTIEQQKLDEVDVRLYKIYELYHIQGKHNKEISSIMKLSMPRITGLKHRIEEILARPIQRKKCNCSKCGAALYFYSEFCTTCEPPKATIWDRFFSKVKLGTIIRPNVTAPCFEWQAGGINQPYGKRAVFTYRGIGDNKAKPWYATRALWEMINGIAIDEDIMICHHCDNPSCVRPDHWFLGTAADNRNDAASKNRATHKLTHTQVKEIREAYGVGPGSGNFLDRMDKPTQEQLAEKYGVSTCTISFICSPEEKRFIHKTVK